MTPLDLVTEFEFTLPRGLLDESGQIHQQGKMRLATGRDELVAQRDRRAADLPGYLSLVLLSQVITQLGTLPQVQAEQLENLFTQDLAYLKEFYNRVNQQGDAHIPAQCPQCGNAFEVELALSGES
ncbi:MAG: phage tail assembly protein [Leptolyngbya sp. SIO4C5]|uniref:phage tail assembly protein n=1 Tax=Sphaerothrix gracilis TaxID=3151835 RepID=UPI0013C116E6|nr:phage tail assembly protein [Leptolyngbya sp. SIO4C5]